jgi:hypothetical protein
MLLFVLLSCSAGPGGISEIDDGTGGFGPDSTNPGDPNGNGGGEVASGPGNPATRPTPGFTEVEMRPATSTTLPAPAAFLKALSLNLDPLLDIDEVRIFAKNFNFEDALSPGVEYPGGFVIRLVRNSGIVDQALPPLGSAVLPEGDYSNLDLELDILDPDEIPIQAFGDPLITDNLVGHSIVVDGVLELDVPIVIPLVLQLVDVRFRFVSTQIPRLRIETPTPISLFGQDTANNLFFAFKIKAWLDLSVQGLLQTLIANLDIPTLLDLVDGLLVISADSPNPQIAAIALQIEANINASLRFAPSADALFDEGDVLESSFSFVLP